MEISRQEVIKRKTRFRSSAGGRFSQLATMGEKIFHADDLANIWNIRNPSTLHTTLARYTSQGLMYRVQKGLYSLSKPDNLSPYLLGIKALHGPAYISCETVLFDNGVINQPPHYISIVSGISRRFFLAGTDYRSRRLSDEFLFNDAGIEIRDGIRIASVSRAIVDMLYFNPKKHFDVLTAVNWNEVRTIMPLVGYPIRILKHYDDSK
ncbi:hypothetical protein HY621_03205 [Candidatus Uhrbacteria bacterium]|nr:hypothetical protein [Candidatus Uhrbacteria bacterium]